MKTYARIENGTVVELLSTAADPTHLFNPALSWREVTMPGVQIGWLANPGGFAAPPASIAATMPPAPSLPQLQADLAALTAKFAAFTSKSGG